MSDDIAKVRAYHRATKHSFQGYAPSPGFLDWESQPNPFRRYQDAPLVALPLVTTTGNKRYSQLYDAPGPAQPLTANTLALFLELAFGLSAWKTTGTESWALRHNPSSGNLHPTEAYVVLWQGIDAHIVPGIYHYAPLEQGIELRARLSDAAAARLQVAAPGTFGALGLTSIVWREEWKYGSRALRYCQHDVGHALAAARYSAAVLSWQLTLDSQVSDDQIAAILGLTPPEDPAVEPEYPDALALFGPCVDSVSADFWLTLAGEKFAWQGRANTLSDERVQWPQIVQVSGALHKRVALNAQPALYREAGAPAVEAQLPAETVIRRRRSAQRMVLGEGLDKPAFLRMLARTLPSSNQPPFDVFPYPSAVNLLLFVHQVEGLESGLYMLVRAPETLVSLRAACTNSTFSWQPVADSQLPLYALSAPLDVRKTASQLSCYQGIAGHSAFSVGMLAAMQSTLETEGAWAYRRLFWETGLIGQLLYLEAGASGLSGTGIGCFFDNNVHDLLGLAHEGDWQSIYHFTIGKAREDQRLTTLSGYHHLQRAREVLDEPVSA